MISDLQRKTKFRRSELESLHNDFVSVLSVDSAHTHSINMIQFAKLFSNHVEWWNSLYSGQEERVFKLLDKNGNGVVSFVDYIIGLNVIKHGVLLQLQKFAFDLYSTDGILNQNSCTMAIATVHALIQQQQQLTKKLSSQSQSISTSASPSSSNASVPTFASLNDTEEVKRTWAELADDPEKQTKIDFQTFQRLTHVIPRKA